MILPCPVFAAPFFFSFALALTLEAGMEDLGFVDAGSSSEKDSQAASSLVTV